MTTSTSPRRREDTRRRLLDAARLVLAETGIQGATVETICERAGFSRGAFYSNYDSKDALVLDLFARERDLVVTRMREALDAERGTADAPAFISRLVRRFIQTYSNDRTSFLIQQEFVIHAARHPDIRQVLRELWRDTEDQLAAVASEAADALGMRLTVPPSTAALLLHGAFEIAAQHHFVDTDADVFSGERLDDLVEAMLSPMLVPLGESA